MELPRDTVLVIRDYSEPRERRIMSQVCKTWYFESEFKAPSWHELGITLKYKAPSKGQSLILESQKTFDFPDIITTEPWIYKVSPNSDLWYGSCFAIIYDTKITLWCVVKGSDFRWEEFMDLLVDKFGFKSCSRILDKIMEIWVRKAETKFCFATAFWRFLIYTDLNVIEMSTVD